MRQLKTKMLLAATMLAVPATLGAARPQPIEPVPVPAQIEQGVSMIYVDPELRPTDKAIEMLGMSRVETPEQQAAQPMDLFVPMNPMVTQLRRGLIKYHQQWGRLPAVFIPAGPVMKKGSTDPRVAQLRYRLGLAPGNGFDATVDKKVRDFQRVHGLKVDGLVAGKTLNALSLPPRDYELRLAANIERAKRLPDPERFPKYVMIDAGDSELSMVDRGKTVGKMKVIVGTKETPTPMMAAMIRYVNLNPYWNVPPDLVQTIMAKHVLEEGPGYLTYRHYEIMADWSENAPLLDPAKVDWQAVADRRLLVRMRRGPSPGNSMGDMKFMLPNDFGIYLHDYPEKAKFADSNLWISNGCVRLSQAKQLAKFLFGYVPTPKTGKPEERVDLPTPIPVYMTYFTAVPSATDGVTFRGDPYDRDQKVLASYYNAQVPIGTF
ncbi:L,D-transpeptidase family protein [Sphingomonas sp. ASV193]|uniref:L,D-transpeptidase family protein n=1 Tax=Sphingomonas sp. ASV193 TaxID=3144405 RepID=UPI0032E85D3D